MDDRKAAQHSDLEVRFSLIRIMVLLLNATREKLSKTDIASGRGHHLTVDYATIAELCSFMMIVSMCFL